VTAKVWTIRPPPRLPGSPLSRPRRRRKRLSLPPRSSRLLQLGNCERATYPQMKGQIEAFEQRQLAIELTPWLKKVKVCEKPPRHWLMPLRADNSTQCIL
jgi:hypothetical protein